MDTVTHVVKFSNIITVQYVYSSETLGIWIGFFFLCRMYFLRAESKLNLNLIDISVL